MNAVAEATWGNNSENGWEAQAMLMFSEASAEYFREIQERANRLNSSTPQRPTAPVADSAPQSLRLTLVSAPGDESKDRDYQLGLTELAAALRAGGVRVSPEISPREGTVLDAPSLGVFDIKVALGVAAPLCTALDVWLQAQYGRKVRLRVGEKEIEAEAPTIKQIEKLLDLANSFKERKSIEQVPQNPDAEIGE